MGGGGCKRGAGGRGEGRKRLKGEEVEVPKGPNSSFPGRFPDGRRPCQFKYNNRQN